MATPSAPHKLQLGPAKTRALPALPSGLIGIRMISPKSVFATNISPRLLKAIPFAPNGPNDGTAGCTRPQGPGAVVPFNSVLSDHILKWPSLSRRQIAPPPESDTYRLPRRSKARPFQSPGPLATCSGAPPSAGTFQMPLPTTAINTLPSSSSLTPSGNIDGNVATVVTSPPGANFTTLFANGMLR